MIKTISGALLLFMLILLTTVCSAQIPFNCNNTAIVITDTIITQACTQNGQIDVGVTGGVAPYTFLWLINTGSHQVSTSQNFTGAYAGGYTLRVTDSHGACNSTYIYLAPAFQLQVGSTPDTTCPANSGSASVRGFGGNIPYSYLWSNGATTALISNLAAGSYDVTVSDASGCMVVASRQDSSAILVNQVGTIQVNVTGQNPANCQNNNGSISTTVSGGTAPYNYQWAVNQVVNPAYNTAQLSGLQGNVDYNVTVTDAHGCIGIGYDYNITFTSPINLNIATTPQNCNNLDGTATATANGTSGPYTFLWGNGSTTQQITGLAQGNYTVTVTDANSCVNISVADIYNYSPVQANVTSTNQLCNSALGTATSAPTLGTAPYTYIWSNNETTATITGLAPGYYGLTVTDNVGCQVSDYAFIQLGSLITSNQTQTNQVCNGALGTANLAPTGGVPPYTYLWGNGAITASINNLVSGNYLFTITDANGCTLQSNVFINYYGGIQANLYLIANPVCSQANGSVGISINSATYPLTYAWSNGSTVAQPSNLAAGYYTVTITQTSNNCSVVKDVSLLSVSPMSAAVDVTPATCIFTDDGIATVAITGGTPPYVYQWGNGSTTASADSLDARWGIGVYVTDANGCRAEDYAPSVGYQNLSCAAVITGTIVDDVNLNCMQDPGDGTLQNTYIQCSPGHGTLSDVYGNYKLLVPAGNYAVTQYALYRNQGCPTGSLVLNNCTATSTYALNNFYDWPINVQDLRVSFVAIEQPRPGFTHTIRVYYQNNGLLPVSNAVVTFNYDSTAVYMGGGTSFNAADNTVTIDCGLLAPSFGYGYTDLLFTTKPTTPLGTLQTYTASIVPVVNDATPPNNTETQQMQVVSSYDPNFLEVAPKGTGAPGYILHSDSVLKYTIHFQNTGNYAASTVAIKDTLDPGLDPSTIQLGASSMPVTYQLDDNVLIFLLDPAYLPDSAQDPVNSNGAVSFYIRQLKGLPQGTEIHNKTAIYFDFNLPVPTNAVVNTLFDTATGIITVADNIGMQLVPNPGAGQTNVILNLQQNFSGTLQVTNLLGQTVHAEPLLLQPGSYTIPLNLNNEASGIYLVHVNSGNASRCLKFVKTQ